LDIGAIWDLIALQPVINVLVVLTHYLFNNFGLAIIALTIVVNLAMYPLTMRQLRSTKAMQALQPKLAELQKKYAKDKQKLAQEQMKLYKESGMNPAGCLLPMLVQMPVWIALYQSIIRVLAVVPEDFLGLSQYLYSWDVVYSMLPLGSSFLWLNLATPDIAMAILVGASMWVQQKMTMPPAADPRQATQSRMMLWLMPIMFGFLCISFPSGLALFWFTSTVIRVAMQYFMTGGWGNLFPSAAKRPPGGYNKYMKRIAQVEKSTEQTSTEADIVVPSSTEEAEGYESSGDKGQERRGGYLSGFRSIRRQSGRGKGHRPK
jgi:YidC/Oxa1 family membrane protein insertase